MMGEAHLDDIRHDLPEGWEMTHCLLWHLPNRRAPSQAGQALPLPGPPPILSLGSSTASSPPLEAHPSSLAPASQNLELPAGQASRRVVPGRRALAAKVGGAAGRRLQLALQPRESSKRARVERDGGNEGARQAGQVRGRAGNPPPAKRQAGTDARQEAPG
jgi:hypothetical protein